MLAGTASAQKKKANPDEGYIPTVAPEAKTKHHKDEIVQPAPPPAPEIPSAVSADTARLVFQVSPLSSKGLLSQQTREALKELMRSSHGHIVKLRAFVAGSGDLRRIGEIATEMFQEKHLPLPAVSVAQVGALPLEEAQVVIEAIEEDRKSVNPNGLAFLAGQPAASVSESLNKLKDVLAGAGLDPSDTVAATCFVSSLSGQPDAHDAMTSAFPMAALDYVQMQRAPVSPAANCEAVARLGAGASAVASPAGIAVAASPQVVITGTQLAFGNKEEDAKLAYERLQKTLEGFNSDLAHVAMVHLYITAGELGNSGPFVKGQFGARHVPAMTLVPFESLPSLDAVFGIDAIAAPRNP